MKVCPGTLYAASGVVYGYTAVAGAVVVRDGVDARDAFPALTTCGGSVSVSGSAQVTLPALTTCGGSVRAYDFTQVNVPTLQHQGDASALSQALATHGLALHDGILSRVVRRRGAVTVLQRIGSTRQSYVVTDGTHTAHGDTLAEARADLRFKQGGRDTSAFMSWTLETVVSRADAILAYRAVTGACQAGIRAFLVGRKIPAKLPVSRILTETVGQYGHDAFAAFINKAAA